MSRGRPNSNLPTTTASEERLPLLFDQHDHRERGAAVFYKRAAFVLSVLVTIGVASYFHMNFGKGTALSLDDAESLFLNIPSNDSAARWLRHYTSGSHLAGRNNRSLAEWTRDSWLQFGIRSAELVEYQCLFNFPRRRRVAIDALGWEAKLAEDVVAEDPTSSDPNAIPTFHAHSMPGTAEGRLIYANYGRLKDFSLLANLGVNLTGTIVLTRYGAGHRGMKIRAAEMFGAIGVLIFSDPADDGPVDKGDGAKAYPEGPWRPPSSVQRGSVQYSPIYSGDPLTPGWASTKDAPRLDRFEATNLPSIPSLPLSYEDALPLLRALEGKGQRIEGWRGGLKDIGYWSGPSEVEVSLVNDQEEFIAPIWDVIGRIEGWKEPDRAIVIGNHRDAWSFGAVDPGSGSATFLEVVRGLGELLNYGWRPRRTIILTSWDAEEWGLMGSTEWVEDNAEWLRAEAVAYINVDNAASGPHFYVSASPSLTGLVRDVTKRVTDPRSGKSVYDVWRAETNPNGNQPKAHPLGAGSDYVAFLDFIGISSMDLRFKGDYGVYHSNYDSYHFMEKFGDPDFQYHKTLAQIWGLITLRLSSLPILPFKPTDYAAELDHYIDVLTTRSNLTFPTLRSVVSDLLASGRVIEQEALDTNLNNHDALRSLNNRLYGLERQFINPAGIPTRPWYKHVVYAPDLWAGYTSQPFPTIAEAIRQKDWEGVRALEAQVSRFVKDAAEALLRNE